MLRPWTRESTHEDLFIQSYDQLLGWALKISGHDRQLAEDLVQEAFIQFTRTRPDLSRIKNLEGYLYTTLRNRHISHVRRVARSLIEPLPMLDYDCAEIGLRASDPRKLIQTREELRAVCRFACARKEASRSGSALLLRFFHAFFPTEIARIMKSTRAAVDIWVSLARTEARDYLDSPCVARSSASASRLDSGSRTPTDFLCELQDEIFESCKGECLNDSTIERLYAPGSTLKVETRQLAHIASCRHCLEAASRIAGLPPSAGRHPMDSIGPDRKLEKTRSSKADQLKRSFDEVFEHSPTKLFVSLNGFFIGSQTIGPHFNELTLSGRIEERLAFIEVFSEQGLLLLSADIEPPPEGEIEQTVCTQLSEGRSLEASVSFAEAWPTIKILFSAPPADVAAQSKPAVSQSDQPEQARVLTLFSAPRLTLARRLATRGFWLQPRTVSVAIVGLLIAALFFRLVVSPVRATELLRRAASAEQALLSDPATLVHRRFAIEKREVHSGNLISRSIVEVWQSATPFDDVLSARRVYDEQGALVAAEWVKSDGSRTIYSQGAVSSEREAPDPTALLTAEASWRLELSPAWFLELINYSTAVSAQRGAGNYVVTYEGSRDSLLSKATLVLDRTTLRPTEQVLMVAGPAPIEYRLELTGFEQLPVTSVPRSLFAPGSDAPKATGVDRGPGLNNRSENTGKSPSKAEHLQTPASVELELEVAYLLNAAGANTGEQVSVTRLADGRLLVRGVLDTDARKRAILSSLRPVLANPAVRVELTSAADASRQRGRPSTASDQIDLNADSSIPLQGDLREYLLRQGVSHERLDSEVREFANRMLTISRGALRHAWALKRISDQFKPGDVETLGAEAKEKRLAMIREHSIGVQQATDKLRAELRLLLSLPESANTRASEPEITNDSEMTSAINRLAAVASINDETIRSAFTISSSGATASAVKSPRFWEGLDTTSGLAARIAARSRASGNPR